MRIGIGTAQFGTKYGVTNRVGQVSRSDAGRILGRAAERGVNLLDTAAAYGESESILGGLLWAGHPFRIVTKLGPLTTVGDSASHEATAERVHGACHRSLDRLRQDSLYALLVHQAADLLCPAGGEIWESLTRLKEEGLVHKIGVSVYTAAEIDEVLKSFVPDLVQLPINALSQTLARGQRIARLRGAGVEIHARSVFLQGILLANPRELPVYFRPYTEVLERFHQLARELRVSPLRLALGYVSEVREIDAYVVGITSVPELDEILDAAGVPLQRVPDWSTVDCSDDALTNPGRWPKDLR